jgi:hypothetical protein
MKEEKETGKKKSKKNRIINKLKELFLLEFENF